MPKALHDLANKLQAQGNGEDKSWAIATSVLQNNGTLQKGINKLVRKGGKPVKAARKAMASKSKPMPMSPKEKQNMMAMRKKMAAYMGGPK